MHYPVVFRKQAIRYPILHGKQAIRYPATGKPAVCYPHLVGRQFTYLVLVSRHCTNRCLGNKQFATTYCMVSRQFATQQLVRRHYASCTKLAGNLPT